MFRSVACAAALLLTTASVAAGQAEICYSAAVPYAQHTAPTNDTVFQCPVAGDRTLPQLAQEGWEIVQLTPVTVPNADPGLTAITDQLVIQKR